MKCPLTYCLLFCHFTSYTYIDLSTPLIFGSFFKVLLKMLLFSQNFSNPNKKHTDEASIPKEIYSSYKKRTPLANTNISLCLIKVPFSRELNLPALCYANFSPSKIHPYPNLPQIMNVTLFGKRVFTDVIKVRAWKSHCVSAVTRLVSLRIRMGVQTLAPLSGLRILYFCEMQCRLQTGLGSSIAVVVMQASSYSSDLTPSLGTSVCHKCSPKKTKKKKRG